MDELPFTPVDGHKFHVTSSWDATDEYLLITGVESYQECHKICLITNSDYCFVFRYDVIAIFLYDLPI